MKIIRNISFYLLKTFYYFWSLYFERDCIKRLDLIQNFGEADDMTSLWVKIDSLNDKKICYHGL